jgi:hypothetical protein
MGWVRMSEREDDGRSHKRKCRLKFLRVCTEMKLFKQCITISVAKYGVSSSQQ